MRFYLDLCGLWWMNIIILMPQLHWSMHMTLIIHEMFRKTRKGNQTQQKDKVTTQLAKQLLFKEKLAVSGGTSAHNIRILGDALTN